MKKIAKTASEGLTALSLFLFGYGGKLGAWVLAVGLCVQWNQNSKRGALTTFQVWGAVSDEAKILLIVLAYQVFFHLVRYGMAMLASDNQKTLKEQPTASSFTVYSVGRTCLMVFGLFYAVWIGFAAKGPQTSYWLMPTLLAVSGFSWWAAKKGFLFDYKVSERVRIPYSDSDEQALAQPLNVARREIPTLTFKDIYGNTEIKRRLLDAAKAIIGKRGEGKTVRNGILLTGEPGNGKTVLPEALAGELKVPFFKLTHSDVASQWVGERTVRIKAAFDQAINNQPCLLFIDEIDSFIPDRSGSQSQVKEDNDVVNSLLTLLVDIRKHQVVVVAASNYLDRLDGAAVREGRFDFKVEITPPDEEARIGLLTSGLRTNLPKFNADPATIKAVAQRWNGFSVKRILAVTEELPSYLGDLEEKGTKKSSLVYDDFMAALRRIQGRKGASPENVKGMDEMILSEGTREALDLIAGLLRDPERVERLGGRLPSGILFYGPPGTGKTEACKALAKEVDWAFLVATGPDLARDPKALEKLHAQAKELRPAIVFIDEADDLLRSREFSSNTESTNKLLTIMDGVNDRVRDVLWVAATNHPDNIDPALLRGGRFTQKVEFVRPDEHQLATHITSWLEKRNLKLDSGLTVIDIASAMGDQSIANAEAVLQYAVNRAIAAAKSDEVTLRAMDVERGVTTVLGSAG